jgi:hypothetical protein
LNKQETAALFKDISWLTSTEGKESVLINTCSLDAEVVDVSDLIVDPEPLVIEFMMVTPIVSSTVDFKRVLGEINICKKS